MLTLRYVTLVVGTWAVVILAIIAAALVALLVMGLIVAPIWNAVGPGLNAIAGGVHDLVNEFPFWGYANRSVP